MSSPTSTTKSTIMLIDDEKEIAILFQKFLEEMGYETDFFTDPLVALEKFIQSSQKYSIVLTDLRMPSMSGIELAQKIREIDDNVVIDLITAFDVDEQMRKDKVYQEAKIHKVLQKPLKLLDLKIEIENCFEE